MKKYTHIPDKNFRKQLMRYPSKISDDDIFGECEILTEKIHAEKLQRFEELKSAIESGRMSTDLGELKNYLIEIDEGIFGFVPDPEKL